MVSAVNNGDLHGRAFERLRGGQSAEARANDDYVRKVFAHVSTPIHSGTKLSSSIHEGLPAQHICSGTEKELRRSG